MSTSSGWESLSSHLETSVLETKIRAIIGSANKPWNDVGVVPKSPVDIMVVNVLQKEMYSADRNDLEYFARCFKCLRALSKARDIFPQCFRMSDGIIRDKGDPIDGGGAADIWRGTLGGKGVCLKVLRTFSLTAEERKRLLKELCREAVIWKQLHHKNILPFLGLNTTSFGGRYCLISPWMNNRNIIKFLESNQDHDRMKSIREIASAVVFLHNFKPPIVHGDIRGNNILIADDHRCLLADFGSSLIIATQVPSSNTLNQNSTRWLAPEFQLPDSSSYEIESSPARDIYALGCTIIEIFTLKSPFSHLHHTSSVTNLVINNTSHPRPPRGVFPSDKLWKLVEDCMNIEAKIRPSATGVEARLRRM
ncbi:kinase-like domain-containing protein [Armillaria borealis]|uniref:Kinase-like domain-containing protein n=1 Tax=Armillaria borealis TaxID=47425 RepID=A0AA39JRF0_9AGAR|nr:kinase-like domain-containing protein [Armillaria borealis]